MKPTEVAAKLADRFADRISDWVNPILVKESRQALKSRQFIITFLLLLGLSWLASFLYVLGVYSQTSAPGRQLFIFYYFILAVTILLIVPFTAYRSLLSEREQQTYEVLSVTTLKPRQILLGKLGSAVVQMFIYYSALMPFIAFTFLLRGIDFPTIAYFLVVGFVLSVAVSLVTLTASTFSSQKQWQVISTFGVLWMLVMVLIGTAQFMIAAMQRSLPFEQKEFWFAHAGMFVVLMGYGLLLEQIAVAQLTFESDNRSTGIRLVASGLHLLVLAAPLGEWLWLGSLNLLSPGPIFFAMLQLTVMGLFFVTESDQLSHRLQRSLGRMGIKRLPAVIYYPGGSRGLIFVLVHLGLLLFVVYFAGSLASTRTGSPGFSGRGVSDPRLWQVLMVLSQYMVIYIGGAAALARAGRAAFHEFRPALARVLTVIIGMGLTMIPLIIEIAEILPKSKPWVAVFNPALVLSSLESAGGEIASEAKILLAVWCVLTLLVNLPGMLRAVAETLNASQTHAVSPPVPGAPVVQLLSGQN